MPNFKTNESGPGFHMTIGDQVISVQWHRFAYSDNRDNPEGSLEANTAEIAIFPADGSCGYSTRQIWREMGNGELHDDVIGWLTSDEVAGIIAFLFLRANAQNEKVEQPRIEK
jgi:hypothetical protein